MDPTPAPTSAGLQATRPLPHRPIWRRPLAWLASAVIVAGLALGLAVQRAWQSTATLPWVLAHVPGLQADGVQGSLAGRDLRIQQLRWMLPASKGELTITGLSVSGVQVQPWWQPALHGGAWAQVTLQSARVDSIGFRSGPPTDAPPPTSLRLPVQLRVDTLQIAQLTVNDLPPVRSLQASLDLGADHGATHRVQLGQLVLEKARVSGTLQLGADGPMPLSAQLQALATEGRPWQAQLSATGPLARLQLEAQVQGEARGGPVAPAAQASATLQTWAAWPLAALQLRTRQFDLASLSARLPATMLDGQVQVQSSGLDQPASAQVHLRNAQAGRLDQGRLPMVLLDATLAAAPRHPERVELRAFELQFADGATPAGRLSGQGQWNAGVLDMALQLHGVLPALLDGRAAAVRASGSLALHATGLLASTGVPLRPQLSVKGRLNGQPSDGRGVPLQLDIDADMTADGVLVHQADASAGEARANLAGQVLREAAGWRVQGRARLEGFDPRPWWRGAEGSAWRQGPHRLSGQLKADLVWRGARAPATLGTRSSVAIGDWLQALAGQADLDLAPSVLAGLPVSGELHLTGRASGGGVGLRGAVQVAGNQVELDGLGGGAAPDDRWQLKAHGPQLGALAPLWRLVAEVAPAWSPWLPTAGQLEANARVDGRWPDLRTSGSLHAQSWHSKALQLDRTDLQWDAGERTTGATVPLTLKASVLGLDLSGQRLDRVEAQLSGNLRDHRLRLVADSPARPPAWTETMLGPTGTGTRLEAEGHGAWQADAKAGVAAGRWQLDALQVRGGARDARGSSRPWLLAQDLAAELQVAGDGAIRALRVAPGRVQLLSTALRWRQADWQAGPGSSPRFDLSAELETLNVPGVLQKLQPTVGWGGDLTLAGRIDIHRAERLDADIVLERLGGDLQVTDELGTIQAMGLSELRLALTAHDGLWQFAQGLAGSQIGQMAGAQVIRTAPTARWPEAGSPLQGVVEARVDKLGVWGLWVPPGWRLSGSLHTSAVVAGSVGAPEISGQMSGQGLGARNVLQGIVLSDGELSLTLSGDRARIERMRFKAGEGTLELSGAATLGARPSAQLQVLADHFRLLGRIDRRLVASGKADVALDPQRLKVDGRFVLDEGLIDLSQGDAPGLDSDVTVVPREGAGAPGPDDERVAAGALPTPLRNAEVAVVIELGNALKLRGRGLDTGVRGELRVSSPGGQMSLNGTVRALGGSYAAYGQKLEISRGEISFSGPANNPRLDVLAVRPNIDAQVGVAITGTALAPRIRLHSEPDMSEMDKLSWLVLGRGPDGLGRTDTALLQRAAVALLAGEGKAPTDELLGALGITDFSVRQTDGTVRETIVSLGKQLSRRWYVGYERSLNATTGTWQLIYRVAQRFTLRAQTGETTAFDLIWSWRFN
ncbi:MAG: translocation/assembly module TamB domain-containing protein [Ideonella sp.]|nr:translocation/assembly module TamB domain-containing protein [Ideonella sp.]